MPESHGRFQNPVEAALTGLFDLVRKQPLEARFDDGVRLDGKTCLVTGASSGLGFAVAVLMAQRGARVLMACRSGVPEKGEEVRRLSGSDSVEMLQVDLSDLEQVHRLADTLKARGERLDVVIENAGVASPRAKPSAQGLEAMFVTNYLSKFLLVHRLLEDGTIRNASFTGRHREEGATARVIFVSSDSHQGASAIDWAHFGDYREFGVNGAINNYSYFKLVMNTFATELSRRAQVDGQADVGVHVMCPGPVDTNIVRDAPLPLRVFLRTVFKVFFRAPDVAARPVVYMSGSADFEGDSARYLHMFNEKKMDPKCYDEAEARRLWDRSVALLQSVQMWPRPATS